MLNLKFYLGFVLLSLILTACQVITWQKVAQHVSQTATAYDGSVAIVMLSYEQNLAATDPTNIFAATRNFTHQIWVKNPDGSDKKITPIRAGRDASGSLHYMKHAGYILLGLVDEQQRMRYEKIDLHNGTISLIRHQSNIAQTELCPIGTPLSFVVENLLPAENGEIIAYIYSPSCFTVVVEFLQAQNLTLIKRQQLEITGVHEAVWQGEDLVIYNINAPEQALRLRI